MLDDIDKQLNLPNKDNVVQINSPKGFERKLHEFVRRFNLVETKREVTPIGIELEFEQTKSKIKDLMKQRNELNREISKLKKPQLNL